MCDYGLSAAIITATVAAGSAYVGYQQGQAQMAEAAAARSAAMRQAQFASQLELMRGQSQILQLMGQQEDQKAIQSMNLRFLTQDASNALEISDEQYRRMIGAINTDYQNVARKTKESAATALTRAAEGGVGGLSVNYLLADYVQQEYDSRLALDTENRYLAQDYNTQLRDVGRQLGRANESTALQQSIDAREFIRRSTAMRQETTMNLAQINDPSRIPSAYNNPYLGFSAALTAVGGIADAASGVDWTGLGLARSYSAPRNRTSARLG